MFYERTFNKLSSAVFEQKLSGQGNTIAVYTVKTHLFCIFWEFSAVNNTVQYENSEGLSYRGNHKI